MEYQIEGYIRVKVMLDVDAESEEDSIIKAKEYLTEHHRLDVGMPMEEKDRWCEFHLNSFEVED